MFTGVMEEFMIEIKTEILILLIVQTLCQDYI